MKKICLDSEKFWMQVELVKMINEGLDRQHDFLAQADPKLWIEVAETPNLGGKIAALEPRKGSLEEIKKAIGIETDDKKLRKFLNKYFENKVTQSTKKVGRRRKKTGDKKAGRPPIIYDVTPDSQFNIFYKKYLSKREELSDTEKELIKNAFVIIGYEDKIKNTVRACFNFIFDRLNKEFQERDFDPTSVLKTQTCDKEFMQLVKNIYKNNSSNKIKKPNHIEKINEQDRKSLERMVDFVMIEAALIVELVIGRKISLRLSGKIEEE